MKAFILAGGFATRLWPLTEKRAKPLLPLAGKPIITHLVEKIPQDLEITVSTNAAFKEGFDNWEKSLNHPNLKILIEDTKNDSQKLGALGAVKKWIDGEKINEDVLLITGDNYIGFELADFLGVYDKDTPLLAVYDMKDKLLAASFGVVELNDDSKTMKSFEEKPKEPNSTLVSTGCALIPASLLPVLTDFAKRHHDNIGGIFEEFINKKIKVACFLFKEPWFDIGSFSNYLEATKKIVGAAVIKEGGSHIENSKFSGSVVLGTNSKVSASKLENAVLFENCEIEDCDLSDCIIDNNCKLKGVDLRGKIIRENTRLVL